MLKEALTLLKEIVSQRDISFLVFIISLFLLPLSINLSTFTLIVALFLKVIQVLLKRNKLYVSKTLKNAAIVGLLFFAYIIINSISQTGFNITFKSFEKQYLHFAIFFLMPMLLRSKRENKLLIYAFFVGTILAVVYVFIFVVINNMTFNKYAFADILDIHHTYLSMYLLAFINYCMVLIMGKKNNVPKSIKLILAIVVLLSFGVMFFLNSKAGMILFLLLFIIHSFPDISKKNVIGYVIALILILSVVSFFNNKIDINYKKALDFRLQVWEMSFEVFSENVFFGDLSLSEKDRLNYKHYVNGKYYFLDSDLNSHNQYLSILMKFGFFGFVILLLYGINIFRKLAFNNKTREIREFLGLLTVVLLICYIENIIDRHHGIVYLTIFYNYYLVAIDNAES